MRWSPRGAHLRLHVRIRVLNDDLTRWYRDSRPESTGANRRRLISHGYPGSSPVAASTRLVIPQTGRSGWWPERQPYAPHRNGR
jgi:hypothetical protein